MVRVIEAFLASLLLLSCLAFIPDQPNLNESAGNLASIGQNVLLSLDSNGHLATMIDNRNWADLETSIKSALPLTDWFNLTVHDENMNTLNTYLISAGGVVSDKIVSLNYVCASQNSTFIIYILQLQLSQVGST